MLRGDGCMEVDDLFSLLHFHPSFLILLLIPGFACLFLSGVDIYTGFTLAFCLYIM